MNKLAEKEFWTHNTLGFLGGNGSISSISGELGY